MWPVGWRRRFELEGLHGVRDRPLAPLTTWRIGGPAELFLEPDSVRALAAGVKHLYRLGVGWRVLGGGSNLLVADRGVRGAVISLQRLVRVEHAGDLIIAEAGAQLHSVVSFATRRGLAGLTGLAGIPGRLGGAVFGNAGSRYGCIGDRVRVLDLLRPDGRLERVEPGEGFFGYRRSEVADRIVLRAFLEVEREDPRVLRRRRHAIRRERRATQPGWTGNAGCVFRNPDGDSAGRLIDLADCKGMREGGIEVSRRHANFFENVGGGTEADVRRLVDRVRERVRAVHGIELEWEVRRWDA